MNYRQSRIARPLPSAGVALASAALVFIAMSAVSALRLIDQDDDRVVRRGTTLRRIDAVLSAIEDAESGRRAALPGGGGTSPGPSVSGASTIGSRLALLDGSTLDPGQRGRLARLRELVRSGMTGRGELPGIGGGFGPERADDRAESGGVGAPMDEIRRILAEMSAHERGAIEARSGGSAGGVRRALASLAIATAASLLLLAIAFARLRRDLVAGSAAERSLREQLERWRVTLGSIGDGVIVSDAEGRVTFMNAVAESLCGIGGAEAIGRPLEEVFRIVNGETRESVANPALRSLAEGAIVGLERPMVLLGGDGVERLIDDGAAPIWGSRTKPEGVVLVFRDVGDRTRAERRIATQHEAALALAESGTIEAAARRILGSVCGNLGWEAGALWLVDGDSGRLGRAELRDDPRRVGPESGGEARGLTLGRGEGLPGAVWELNASVWRVDGDGDGDGGPDGPRADPAARSGLRGSFGVPIDLGGEVLGVLEFAREGAEEPEKADLLVITMIGRQMGQFLQRQRAEADHRASDALKGAILSSAIDCIIAIDEAGTIVEWNPAAELVFGYRRDEVLGRTMADRIIPPDLRAAHDLGMDRMRKTGEGPLLGRRTEITAQRRDGTTFPVELSITPTLVGRRRLFTAYVRDLTERKEAEARLSQSEATLSAVLDSLPVGVVIADRAGQIIRDNAAHRELWGARPEETRLDEFGEWVGYRAETGERIKAHEWGLARALLTGEIVRGEMVECEQFGTGQRRVFLKSAAPVRDANGAIIAGVAVAVDVTERRAKELALEESEGRYRTLFESIDEGFCTFEMIHDEGGTPVDYRFLEVNPAFERQTGLVDASGKTARALLPDLEQSWVETYGKVAETGESIRFEQESPAMGRWFEVGAFRVGDPAACRVALLFSDITERRKAEVALRESERRFKSMADSAPAMLWLTDPDHSCTFLSRGWSEYTGQRAPSGFGLGWLDMVHPDDLEETTRIYLEASGRREPFRTDYRLRTADGSYRWATDLGMPWFGPGGEFLGYIGSVLDIADRKRAEEERERLLEQLQDIDRRKNEFIAMLSHELRNPLAAIGPAARLLLGPGEESERAWAGEVITRQVQHMARLVDDLLDVARLTKGTLRLRPELIDVRDTIRHAVDTIRPQLGEKRLRLELGPMPDPLMMEGDPVRLLQIVDNLLTNAERFSMPGGLIRISAERVDDDLWFTVADEGVGISPDLMPWIFEPFVQGERSSARTEGGLGIGLAIARTLVEMHRGRIEAKSEGPGRGTVFMITLPLVNPWPVSEAAEESPPTPGAERRLVRILIVDDNRDLVRGMVRMLERMGFEVLVAYDGPEGIEAAREFHPEIVLLDIGLPTLDGYEVARRIRGDVGLREARIIAVSGYGQDDDRQRSRDAGFDEHLVKPVDPERLMELIGQ